MSIIRDNTGAAISTDHPLPVILMDSELSGSVTDHLSYNGTVDINETTVNFPMSVTLFNFISNDGDTDLYVNFDTGSTTPAVNTLNNTVIIKAGEVLSDFKRTASIVKLKRLSGTGTVRILGV